MENAEADRGTASSEEVSHLSRNRSFKSKQLVRSQAIRESQSPPRTVSPAVLDNDTVNVKNNGETRTLNVAEHVSDSSHVSNCVDVVSFSDKNSYSDDCKKQHPVEIQITAGTWDEQQSEQRQRTKRWLGHKHHSDSSRDLLSNNPRVACVCGNCAACPHCRGRRRRHLCPTKQDSGIVCSDDCPDCSDSEQNGTANADGVRKSDTVEIDDQSYYCRCPERKDGMKPKNLSLGRTDSEEKSEPTGIELVNFIKETLNKNARDRMTLLKIEKELHSLVNDTGRCIVRFPVMTSYGRMLVHRCAALFQLSHHLDQTNRTCVLVSKSGTSGGRLPCTSFREWCTSAFPPSPQRHTDTHAKSILKRDTHSLDETGGGAMSNARSKSLEQREREYERVRRRIFSSDNCNQDESQWPWTSSGPVKVLTPEGGRNKLLKVQSLESGSVPGPPWRGRGAVSKSHSFGGYGGEPAQPPARLLSRQGDLASSSWRLSPSSSGYKTLSLRSTDSVTPSPTGGASPEPGVPVGCGSGGEALVWAVTDMSSVPPGALVIHPQTGRPLTNPDGSVYHFDPANPPVLYDPGIYVHGEPKIDPNNEKRRGKLEKQHSFIDSECECQPTEECRNKCCCNCRRHDACQQRITAEKIISPTEQKNSKPSSPCKSRYEQTNHTQDQNKPYDATSQKLPETNQRATFEPSTNQKTGCETPANQRVNHETNQTPVFESNAYDRSFEATANQNVPFENSTSNQRIVNDVAANQRPRNKPNSQESQEILYQSQYVQGIRNDEVTSPGQPGLVQNHYAPDVVMQNLIAQAKVTPVPMPDPNLRPVPLANVMYPTVPQGYPYVNPCRMDQPVQAMYQQMLPAEEQKQLAPSPHASDNTFRIDPSYTFASVPGMDLSSQCGACVDPNIHPHARSYSVPYAQMEVPTVMPPYQLGNVVLPQAQPQLQQHMQPYPQYSEPLQWQTGAPLMPLGAPPKLLVPELYPVLYPNLYPQYNLVYPQVIPQPYPICQPMYPLPDKQERRGSSASHGHAHVHAHAHAQSQRASKRNSVSGSARTTPLTQIPDDKHVPYRDNMLNNNQGVEKTLSRQSSNEIATKIQQIKEQMAVLNTRDRERDKCSRPREEWKRRNSGNGILGNYPVGSTPGRGKCRTPPTPNDETQLTSAARAIVNTIRDMQAKNNYQDRRNDYQYRRRDREPDRPDRPDCPERKPDADERQYDVRNRNVNPVQLQYRPPYLLRQMSPGTWCRRSPGPVHPVLNHPRRPHPDARNGRR
ncbi:LOW QUALITY PROTEIN: R3H domain containing protein encore [Aphomia sociella]